MRPGGGDDGDSDSFPLELVDPEVEVVSAAEVIPAESELASGMFSSSLIASAKRSSFSSLFEESPFSIAKLPSFESGMVSRGNNCSDIGLVAFKLT